MASSIKRGMWAPSTAILVRCFMTGIGESSTASLVRQRQFGKLEIAAFVEVFCQPDSQDRGMDWPQTTRHNNLLESQQIVVSTAISAFYQAPARLVQTGRQNLPRFVVRPFHRSWRFHTDVFVWLIQSVSVSSDGVSEDVANQEEVEYIYIYRQPFVAGRLVR
jgi:hypothetical protein